MPAAQASHEAALEAADALPAGQLLQPRLPRIWPDGQVTGLHEPEPAAAAVNAGHSEHAEAPPAAKVLAAQFPHAAAPVPAVNLPATQLTHWLPPVVSLKVPALHAVHAP